MTTKKKIALLILSLLILTGGYFAVQYAIYQYNEARGFCATEGKYLNAEEKRRNFVTDYILYAMDFERQRDSNFDARIYISKYDMSDPETIIDLMANPDINKSFEENFGVIAQASVPEYDAKERWIESCQKESVNCSKSEFDNSRYVEEGIKALLNTDNTIDKDYLNSLPDTYTLITRAGVRTYYIYISPVPNEAYQ